MSESQARSAECAAPDEPLRPYTMRLMAARERTKKRDVFLAGLEILLPVAFLLSRPATDHPWSALAQLARDE